MELLHSHKIKQFPHIGQGRDHPIVRIIDYHPLQNPEVWFNYFWNRWKERKIVPATERVLPPIKENLTDRDISNFYIASGGP